ncbi:MAG: hypothetical protein KAJ62_01055 [Desulfobacteraceae bacterium]|nr:hypothetical protein [Desulfobacteraceae bacterium]
MKLFEALPFLIFVYYIRYIDIQTVQDWNLPFFISGVAAFIAIILFFVHKIIFNRILLGINLYLISGAIAIITHQWWLNKIYGELHASGVLAWVVIVGLVCLLFSPHGFIGVNSADKHSIKKFSLLLFFVSICAFSISFVLRENRVFSELIPFTLIFFTQYILKNKVTKIKEGEIST